MKKTYILDVTVVVAVYHRKRLPHGQCTQSVKCRERGLFPDSRKRPLGQSAGGHDDPLPQLQKVNNEDDADDSTVPEDNGDDASTCEDSADKAADDGGDDKGA